MHKNVLIILFLLATGFFMANYLGPRMIIQVDHFIFRFLRPAPIRLKPEGSNINFERLQIISHDHLKQTALLIRTSQVNAKGTIILVHGIRANKEHFWPLAEKLEKHGFNTLMVDLRAHGESEGKYCTFGFYEKHDLKRWIDTLEQVPDIGPRVGVWGQSLGAAVALQTMAVDARLDFGIIESTFSDFKTTAHDYSRFHLGFDIPWLTTYFIWRAEGVGQFYSQMVRPAESARLISKPVLMVHGAKDQRIDPTYGRENFENLSSSRKEFLEIPEASHVNVWEIGGETYFNRALAFIEE